MGITDHDLFAIIEKIANHYDKNICNQYIRPELRNINLPRGDWELIDELTAMPDHRKQQGYLFRELYERIMAMARFVNLTKTDISPRLKSIFSGRVSTRQDDIYRTMAVNNLDSNLGILSDMIHELYMKTVEIDKQSHTVKDPVYKRVSELSELGNLLSLS